MGPSTGNRLKSVSISKSCSAATSPHEKSTNRPLEDPRANSNDVHSINGCFSDKFGDSNDRQGPGTPEAVAVIGLALKFPQDATSPDAFWEMLMDGRSSMTEVPADRFNIDSFYKADGGRTHTLNVRGGHFLKGDLATFDAPFFSISANEAACMDPQQRFLLEITYHALENAGVPMEKAIGSKTAVYVGSFIRDYESIIRRDANLPVPYASTGSGTSILANRLSWFFDFTGPSVAIDTACSSSLIALHLACQSIRSGEAEMAIVAGCNLIFSPETSMWLSQLNFLSPDSRCYSFDSRANGYSRGEGIGVVVLKALEPALQDDTIRAVIRNSGTNQDGRTPGITQPSSAAQEALIRETYERAGLDMAKTRYFEAHGTGTPVGDPLELKGIYSAFKDARPHGEPLYVGAVKSNIGHLEGASGVAGLIKAILTLERGVIPPNIGYEKPNPKLSPQSWNIEFPLKPTTWPAPGLRRVSVSSFGFGGSNAHVILDDAYNYLREHKLHGRHSTTIHPRLPHAFDGDYSDTPDEDAPPNPQTRLLVMSASDEGGIERLTEIYKPILERQSSVSRESSSWFDSFAFTLCEKRSLLPWRSFTTATCKDDMLKIKFSPPVRHDRVPRLSFVFTGQGAQWNGMGRELLHYPKFKESLAEAEGVFKDLGCQWSLIDKISNVDDTSADLDNPKYSQPITTALQVALVDLLASWGIKPTVVIGHSSGEIAAAYCVGISKGLALKVAYYRGLSSSSLQDSSQEPGAMLSAALSSHKAEKSISISGRQDVYIACINSPSSITLSGSREGITAIQETLEQDGVHCRRLRVGVAYHSRYMKDAASLYQSLMQNIEEKSTNHRGTPVAMISSVTAKEATLDSLKTSEYWVANMLSPVRFSDAASHLCSHTARNTISSKKNSLAVDYLLEIGPHSTLQGPLREVLASLNKTKQISYNSVLVRNKCAATTALEVAGHFHTLGYPVNLLEANNFPGQDHQPSMLTNLPSYPFNHTKRYWTESRISKSYRFREHPVHELLGTRSMDWNPLEARWCNRIIQKDNPFVKDHKVNGIVMYPAAGMLCMALEAARQLIQSSTDVSGYRFKDVTFSKAIVLSADPEGTETEFLLRPSRDGDSKLAQWHEFRVCTFDSGEWHENCRGAIAVDCKDDGTDFATGEELEKESHDLRESYRHGAARCKSTVSTVKMYEVFGRMGLDYGPSFQSLSNINYNDCREATGTVDLCGWSSKVSNGKRIEPHVIHPTALDAILQTGLPAATRGGKEAFPTMVPTKVRDLWISARHHSEYPDGSVNVFTKSTVQGFRTVNTSTLGVHSSDGNPYITGDFEMTFVSGKAISSPGGGSLLYNIDWKPDVGLLSKQQAADVCSSSDDSPTPLAELMANEKETLCYATISRTLSFLDGKNTKPGDHIQKYIEWMKRTISRQVDRYLLPSIPTSWTGSMKDDKDLDALYSAVESCDAEGAILVRIARNLQGILTGKSNPLELLFKDDVIDDYYRAAHDGALIFSKTTRYIDVMAHKNPGIKILEIGAGTGCATGYILNTLMHHGENEAGAPRFAEYVYTDVSPSFFERAKKKFNNGRVTFKVLDIEKDPKSQGFEIDHYDLVVAANVLHATADISKSLKHARQLLRPGGKLIMYEGTNTKILRTGLIFGVLPGWWLATEDARECGPLLSVEQWGGYLSNSGFSGTDAVLSNYDEPEFQVCSTIISTAIKSVPEPDHAATRAVIIGTEPSIRLPIINKLQSHFVGLFGSPPGVISIQDIEAADLAGATCIFVAELDRPFLHHMDDVELKAVQKIVKTARGLLWLTRSEPGNSQDLMKAEVTGLARGVLEETHDFRYITLALEGVSSNAQNVEHISKVFTATLQTEANTFETEYAVRDGILCINRLVEAKYLASSAFPADNAADFRIQKLGENTRTPLKLSIGSVGLLDTLRFVADPLPVQPLAADEIEVEVKAIGLNFRDVIIAMGQLPYDNFGNEFAGIVRRVGDGAAKTFNVGDRVACGLDGAFRTCARCKASSAWKIPDDIDFSTAAAMTIVFCTAHYALSHWARLRKGETILIHSGAGGFGQAAVQLAKFLGGEVFVTVGNEEKKKHMMEVYRIPEDHIFSSRTLAFAKGIKRVTNGRGVDVVINSLAGEALRASWDCVAPFGRFIEVGKKDIYSQKVSAFEGLPMAPFAKNVMFASVDLAFIMETEPEMMAKLTTDVAQMIRKQGIFAPQPLNAYGCGSIEQAFRLMQSGKHMGKIVLELHKDDLVPVALRTRLSFDPKATYIIAGGLGGLGRSIASWMVDHGAKYLILLSRSKTYTEEVADFLGGLRDKGIVVSTPPCDISDQAVLEEALGNCARTMPPIQGCIQSSMVIQNAMFTSMTPERFSAALWPKVEGSWNLHKLLPRGLDFFIMLSSYAGIIGGVGQSNYAAGNTYQDALARYRVENGEKAIALDLGGIESVGFLAEHQEVVSFLETTGHVGMREDELLALIEYYCDPNLPIPTPLKSQVVTCIPLPSTLRAKNVDFKWLSKPMFNHLHQMGESSVAAGGSSASDYAAAFESYLRGAESLSQAAEVVCEGLRAKLAQVLGIDVANVEATKPTHAHGVDSLVAVELRNWFKRMVGADVTVFDILGNQTLAALATGVAEKSTFVSSAAKKARA